MRRLLRRLRYAVFAARRERELAEELEFHRTERQRQLERDGVPATAASLSSRRALGNITLAREDARAVWIWSSVERLWQDARYGLRMLRREPGFATIAILTLALGIGANTAIFSAINAVVLRPLPYASADRLVMLWTDDVRRGLHEESTSYLNFLDWRSQSQLFADMAIFRGEPAVILGGDAPDRVLSEHVSANVFPLLGVAPALGRTFTQEEQDRQGMAAPVVGLAIGLLGAIWLTAVISHLLFDVSPTDLPTFLGVALLLVATALMASWLPARRATCTRATCSRAACDVLCALL